MQLLAVAMPKAVLEEYEGVVLAAGYLPGAVLPSTLAALAGLDEAEAPVLVVNAGLGAVTTAIVQAGMLLLHRSVDMSASVSAPADGDVGSAAGEPGEYGAGVGAAGAVGAGWMGQVRCRGCDADFGGGDGGDAGD